MEEKPRRSLYEILQVDANAEPETIKHVFRLLAKKYHPNTPGTGDADEYRDLKEAFKILRSPAWRTEYDAKTRFGRLTSTTKFVVDLLEAPDNESSPNLFAVDLPECPDGFSLKVFSQLNSNYRNTFFRLVPGPGGFYFACNGSIWFVDRGGCVNEYARIRDIPIVSGICFDSLGNLYATANGECLYRIDPNKSGRIFSKLPFKFIEVDTANANDVVVTSDRRVFVSNSGSAIGGIFEISRNEELKKVMSGSATRGLGVDEKDSLWCIDGGSSSLINLALDGTEISRRSIGDRDDFLGGESACGAIASGDNGDVYVTTHSGKILRVELDGNVVVLLSELSSPTGIAFDSKMGLLVLESGKSRLLRLSKVEG